VAGSPVVDTWCEQRRLNKGYVLREKGKPDPSQGGEANGLEFYQLKSGHALHGRVPEEHGQQTGRPLLVVRPGEQQWYSPDERQPLQALLQVERLTGREGQGGDEVGEAVVAHGRPAGG